jgi:hypothetical protein
MKSLRALKAAGLIIVAVVLGLMTVQGSYALWNAVVPSNAGTVQSADFRILVNNVEMKSLAQPLALNLAEIKPGGNSFTSFVVTNKVNATSAMTVKPKVTAGLATEGFADYLTIQTTVPLAGQSCETATYAGMPDLGVIAKEQSKTICVKATLKANTPVSILGRTTTVPAALTVSQMPA